MDLLDLSGYGCMTHGTFAVLVFFSSSKTKLYNVFFTVPVYGGFPVKLRTFIGPRMTFPPSASIEEVSNKHA